MPVSLAGRTSFANRRARHEIDDRDRRRRAFVILHQRATSAAFAAGKAGESADSLSCSFSAAKDASPAARCAAIKRQCGGKFHANYCGDKLLSAM